MQKQLIKYLIIPVISILIFTEVSCTKTSSPNSTSAAFTKVITTDSSYNAVNSFQLSDGSYLVFGADPQGIRSGLMVKLSSTGTVLWQKRMPASVAKLWKVISINGNEFAAAGYKSGEPDFNVNACLFDDNGDLLSSKSNSPGYFPYNNPLDMIQLINGNYAFTGTLGNENSNNNYVYLMVTDVSFNVIYLNTYQIPKYKICSFGMAESNDGTINISGIYQDAASSVFVTYPFLLRTKNNTVQQSFDTIANNSLSPDCIVANSRNQVIIASSTDGTVSTTYKYSPWIENCGSIGIELFDTGGHYNSHISYSGIPGNGLINSINPTSDGGYILCGTVDMTNTGTASSTAEIFAMKLDANLNKQWSNTYDNSNPPAFGANACQTSDGGYLISGQKISFATHYDMVLIKTDANGNVN